MPLYVLLSVVAAFINSFASIFQKLTAKYAFTSFYSYSFFYYLLLLPFGLLLFLIFGYTPMGEALRFIVPMIITFFIANTLLNYVIFLNDASNINPLFPLKLIFVPFITFLMIGERFMPVTYLLMVVIVCGGMLVAIDESFSVRAFFKKGTMLLLLSLAVFTVSDVYVNQASAIISPYQVLAWEFVLLAPTSLLFLAMKPREIKAATPKSIMAMVGILTTLTIFFLLLFKAFSLNVTISNTLSMMSGPLVLLLVTGLGKLKPHLLEEHTKKVYIIRFIGSLIMYVAAIGIVITL